MTPLLDSTLVGEGAAPWTSGSPGASVLILGVGNLLMGDEGAGIHVLRLLELEPGLEGARLLDGGTGGINLLGEFDGMRAVILVDATRDGSPEGTLQHRLIERVAELPRGLGAHDFGLKDLFAAAALTGGLPELHLFTIAVETVHPMCTELSEPVSRAAVEAVQRIRLLAARLAAPA